MPSKLNSALKLRAFWSECWREWEKFQAANAFRGERDGPLAVFDLGGREMSVSGEEGNVFAHFNLEGRTCLAPVPVPLWQDGAAMDF